MACQISGLLSAFDITYQPPTSIKSQVLADFVADFSVNILLEAEKEVILSSKIEYTLKVL